MKKLLLVGLLMVGLLGTAQKMNPKFLKGTWENTLHTVEFTGETKKTFSIRIVINETGEELQVVNHGFNKNHLYIATYYAPSDFKAIGKLFIIDENTMVEDVVSEYSAVLVYKRVQTQEE